MPVFDLKSYRESLKTKYNIADEDLVALDDKGDVGQGFMRQDDYSRKHTALQQQQQQLQSAYTQLQQYDAFVQQLEQRLGPRETWSADVIAQVGAQNPNGSGTVDTSAMATEIATLKRDFANTVNALKQEFKNEIEQVGQGAAAFSQFIYESNEHWRNEYGTSLPKDDFRKFYEDGAYTDPRVALRLFEQPFAQKKNDDAWEKKLEAAREEGRRSAASQQGGVFGGDPNATSAGGWLGNSFPAVGSGGIVDLATKVDEVPADQAAQQFAARMAAARAGTSATGAK